MSNPNEWKKVEMPPAWNRIGEDDGFVLKENDEIVGIYKGKEEGVGSNNANLYTFKTEKDGLVSVWGSSILDTRFKNLEIGEEVRVQYLGDVKSEKTGRTYHNYEVFHRMPEKKDEDIPVIEDEQ